MSWQPETWSKWSHMINYRKQEWARVSHIKQRVIGSKVLTAHSSSGRTMRGRLAHKVLKWREDNFSRHDNLLQNWWGIIFLIYHQFITKHHHHIGCPTEKLVEPVVYFCVLVKFLNIIIIIHFSIIFIIRGQRSRGYQIPPNISNTYYWVTYQSVLGDEGSTVT